MTTPEARAIVDVLLSYFVEHGWTIHMDDRPGQPDEPFIELAAALAALTPLAPEVPPRRDGLRARGVPMPGPNNRDELDRLTQNRETGAATPEPPDSGDAPEVPPRPLFETPEGLDPDTGMPDPLAGSQIAKYPHCGEELRVWATPEPPDSGDGAALDVRRVVKAIENVAKRHGIVKDPPMPLSLARIYGYSTTPDDMDAQIAAEYARLRAAAPAEAREEGQS